MHWENIGLILLFQDYGLSRKKKVFLLCFFSTLANTRPRKSCDQHNFFVALLRCISKVFQKAQTCEIKPLSDLS